MINDNNKDTIVLSQLDSDDKNLDQSQLPDDKKDIEKPVDTDESVEKDTSEETGEEELDEEEVIDEALSPVPEDAPLAPSEAEHSAALINETLEDIHRDIFDEEEDPGEAYNHSQHTGGGTNSVIISPNQPEGDVSTGYPNDTFLRAPKVFDNRYLAERPDLIEEIDTSPVAGDDEASLDERDGFIIPEQEGPVFEPVKATGNVLDNDDPGLDGFGNPPITGLVYDGSLGLATSGPTLISGEWTVEGNDWVFMLNELTGEWTFCLNGPYPHEGPQDAVAPGVFTYTIQDGDGSEDDGDLSINIVDDLPLAEDNAKSVLEVGGFGDIPSPSITGNVITDNGIEGVDNPGVDGFGEIISIEHNGVIYTDDTDDGAIGDDIITIGSTALMGQFVIDTSTGLYGYTIPGTPLLQLTPIVEEFVYTYTDGDSDTASATLTVDILDNNQPEASDPHIILSNFTFPAYSVGFLGGFGLDGAHPSTSLVVDAYDGGLGNDITITNTPVGVTYTDNTGAWILTFGFNGIYSLDHIGAYDHKLPTSMGIFDFTLKDGDNSIDSGSVIIQIKDARPIAVNDFDRVKEGLVTDGNVITGVDASDPDGSPDVNEADDVGADVPVTVVGVAQGETAKKLVDETTVDDGDGDTVAGLYGTLKMESDGTYIYTASAVTIFQKSEDKFTYTISDADGSSSFAVLTIRVKDANVPNAQPSNNPAANSGAQVIDEADGDNGGFTLNASLGDLFDPADLGLDGGAAIPMSVVYNGGLGSASVTDTDPGMYTITSDGGEWSVEFNLTNGEYTFSQYAAYSHAPMTNFADGMFTFTLEDADGSTDDADLVLRVLDDEPVAVDDVNTADENGSAVVGNVIVENDDVGVDVAGELVGLEHDGVVYDENSDEFNAGVLTIDTVLGGTLEITFATGAYEYTPPESAVQPADEVFGYTLEDEDGDQSDAMLTITVDDVHIPNAQPSNNPAANSGAQVIDEADGDNGGFTLNASLGDLFDPADLGLDGGAAIPMSVVYNGGLGSASVTDTDPGMYTITSDGGEWSVEFNLTNGEYTFSQYAAYSHAPMTDFADGMFTFTLEDADGSTDDADLVLRVLDDEPVAVDDVNTADENGSAVVGNVIVENDDVGVDVAGELVGLEHDGVVYDENSDEFNAGVLTIDTVLGGTLEITFATGAYEYTPPESAVQPADEVFGYTLEDEDGDQSDAMLTITVDDVHIPNAQPSNNPAANSGAQVIDEADGDNGGFTLNASLGDLFDPADLGLDGGAAIPMSVVYNGGLGSASVTDTDPGMYTITSDGGEWSVEFNLTNGEYTFSQHAAYSHAPMTDFADGMFTFTLEDADGSTDDADLVLRILDDEPVAVDDVNTADENGSAVVGNVIVENDDVGVDVAGELVGLEHDGVVYDENSDEFNAGVLTIDTVLGGTLEITFATGAYEYTPPESAVQPADEVFGYTLEDEDGDQSDAMLTITVDDVHIPNAQPSNNPAANSGAQVIDEADGDNGGFTLNASLGDLFDPADLGLDGGAAIPMSVVYNGGLGSASVTDTDPGMYTITSDGGEWSVEFNLTNGEYTFSQHAAYSHAPMTDFADGMFTFTLEDADGSTDDADLVLRILDDEPVAVDDVNTADENGSAVVGNVIVENDDVGVDVAGELVGLEHDGVVYDENSDEFNAGVLTIDTVLGGTLEITFATGAYEYTPPESAVQPADEVFGYTLEDEDGDQSDAMLTITVDDVHIPNAQPSNNPAANSGAQVIDEADGDNGGFTLNASLGDLFDPADLGLDGGAAIPMSAVYNGGLGSASVTDTDPGMYTITSDGGEWSVEFNLTNGEYTFSQHAAYSHAPMTDFADGMFTFTLEDADGSTDDADLVLRILDDEPVAVDDVNTADENGSAVMGNVIVENDDVGVDVAVTVVGVDDGNLAGPIAGDVGVAVLGLYGTLVLDADGGYTYTADQTITEDKQDVFTYTIEDSDGSQSTATLTIDITNFDPPLADLVFINEVGLDGDNQDSHGVTSPAGTDNVSFVELVNSFTNAFKGNEFKDGSLEIVGPAGELIIIDFNTMITDGGNVVVEQNSPTMVGGGSFVFYEDGTWQSFASNGNPKGGDSWGYYQTSSADPSDVTPYPSMEDAANDWLLGDDTTAPIAVNLVQGSSVDFFIANGAKTSGLTENFTAGQYDNQTALTGVEPLAKNGDFDGIEEKTTDKADLLVWRDEAPWHGHTMTPNSPALAALLLGPEFFGNTHFSGFIGDQGALLHNILNSEAKTAADGCLPDPDSTNENHVFARVYDQFVDPEQKGNGNAVDEYPIDTNQEDDWTTTQETTAGDENDAGSINPQDNMNPQQDDMNPLQSTGNRDADEGQNVVDLSDSAGLYHAETDPVHGGLGPDFMYGDDNDNTLSGGAHNDFLFGGEGDDKLHGGDDASGGGGADLLVDVQGQNVLIGNNGNDILIARHEVLQEGETQEEKNTIAAIVDSEGDLLIGDNVVLGDVSQFNIALVIDMSGSMNNLINGTTAIDEAREASLQLVQSMKDEGIAGAATINVILFGVETNNNDEDGLYSLFGIESTKEFQADDPALITYLNSTLILANIVDNVFTDFEPPLAAAAQWFEANTPEDHVNRMFFITDGKDNTDVPEAKGHGDFDPADNDQGVYADIYNATAGSGSLFDPDRALDIEIREFGVGESLDVSQLDLLDDGLDNGSETAVMDPNDLSAALTAGTIGEAPTGSDVIYGSENDDFIFGDNLVADDLTDFALLATADDAMAYVESHLIDGQDPDYDAGLVNLNHGVGLADYIFAGDGDDVVFGQGGDDKILGEQGDDVIYGGSGDDFIIGGEGDDTLEGNAGKDTFHFDLAIDEGDNVVVDFDFSDDTLSFEGVGGTMLPDLVSTIDIGSSSFGAGDVTIAFNVGTSITFTGISATDILDFGTSANIAIAA